MSYRRLVAEPRLSKGSLLPLTAVIALSGLLFAASGATANPDIKTKRAQAAAILAQVGQLDAEVGDAAERWNGANYRLGQISDQLLRTRRELARARAGVKTSQARVTARLRDLYVNGEPESAIEVILGARDLASMVDALDATDRIAEQDAGMARELSHYRAKVAARELELSDARDEQARVVQRRAAEKAAIEAKLGERKRLLASVQSEVRRLEAEERRRQAELRRRATAELARQRALAAAEARAAEKARSDLVRRRELAAAQTRAAAKAQSQPTPLAPVAHSASSSQRQHGTAATSVPSIEVPRARVQAQSEQTEEVPADQVVSPAAGDGEDPPRPASPSSEPPAPAAGGSGTGVEAVAIAMRYLGVPYVWGGASPSGGFDCSGLTMYVYAQVGVSLPHYAAAQYGMGTVVERDQLQPGDLVFFRGLGHMGMYIGGGNFIHAPHTGDVVKISSLSESYYTANWVGARRVA